MMLEWFERMEPSLTRKRRQKSQSWSAGRAKRKVTRANSSKNDRSIQSHLIGLNWNGPCWLLASIAIVIFGSCCYFPATVSNLILIHLILRDNSKRERERGPEDCACATSLYSLDNCSHWSKWFGSKLGSKWAIWIWKVRLTLFNKWANTEAFRQKNRSLICMIILRNRSNFWFSLPQSALLRKENENDK